MDWKIESRFNRGIKEGQQEYENYAYWVALGLYEYGFTVDFMKEVIKALELYEEQEPTYKLDNK